MRINNGELSERGLARLLGISQPQIHNVLKGRRRLQADLADRLLEKFCIDLRDLLQIEEYFVLPGQQSADESRQAKERAGETPRRKGPGRAEAETRGLSRRVG